MPSPGERGPGEARARAPRRLSPSQQPQDQLSSRAALRRLPNVPGPQLSSQLKRKQWCFLLTAVSSGSPNAKQNTTPKYIHASFSITYTVTTETSVHGGGGVCMDRMGLAQPQVQGTWAGMRGNSACLRALLQAQPVPISSELIDRGNLQFLEGWWVRNLQKRKAPQLSLFPHSLPWFYQDISVPFH